MCFHPLSINCTTRLPQAFTYPFCYVPHPLCVEAAEKVQAYIKMQSQWHEELADGKMFGVLLVETAQQEIGYLAAYSGNLAHCNSHDYFVPPVYDLLDVEGYFHKEEKEISLINHKIIEVEQSKEYIYITEQIKHHEQHAAYALKKASERLEKNKRERDKKRTNASQISSEENAKLLLESQHQKADFKRLKNTLRNELQALVQERDKCSIQISNMKEERKKRSSDLQYWLFEQFSMLNVRGEAKSINQIFSEQRGKNPPAGTGECAAPKMLQYAFLNNLKPLAMAEFWWGASPAKQVRRHGLYYPACKGKCEPLLAHMLQGLHIEENPLVADSKEKKIKIIYEDDYLVVVDKPEGLPSVPGNVGADSVFEQLQKLYVSPQSIMLVHRLDMDTSGVMVAAKSKEAHKHLQSQFQKRSVKKQYVAILDGVPAQESGEIKLPLCLDPEDRPKQIVHETLGKTAHTQYKVLEKYDGKARIAFYPLTGRTHQLRVHAAHNDGLACPICGDRLYGTPKNRLMLHAEVITFVHPHSCKEVSFVSKVPF